MADAVVRAQALRLVSGEFPGWIEVALVDADGYEHVIVEKVPVLTDRDLLSISAFPSEVWLHVHTSDADGARVHVTLANSLEATEGRTDIEVCTTDVRWT